MHRFVPCRGAKRQRLLKRGLWLVTALLVPAMLAGPAFAGVSGGFSANLTPGQLDALLFGVTESALENSCRDRQSTESERKIFMYRVLRIAAYVIFLIF